jgi:hypothetical protein
MKENERLLQAGMAQMVPAGLPFSHDDCLRRGRTVALVHPDVDRQATVKAREFLLRDKNGAIS